jgi:hypothetical protein
MLYTIGNFNQSNELLEKLLGTKLNIFLMI